jgi:hypothetical protein
VGEVETGNIHSVLNQLFQQFPVIRVRSHCTNYFCLFHQSILSFIIYLI